MSKVNIRQMGLGALAWATLVVIALPPVALTAPGTHLKTAHTQEMVRYWTQDRRDNAIPRDLVIDAHGKGYLRLPSGALQPYGVSVAASKPVGNGKPVNDTTAPNISQMNPGSGDTIGASYTFSAIVTDNVAVKSVTFSISAANSGVPQNFSAHQNASNPDIWELGLQGFADGNWSWRVTATDTAKGGGNTSSSNTIAFVVDTNTGGGGSGGGSGDTITGAHWTNGGKVLTATGRLYFEMPNNKLRKRWSGYVCSGSVVTDNVTGRSVILTAAHCAYDDANKAFARNVLFIPDQDHTTGSGTDLNCNNDPLGCWAPVFAVTDVEWTNKVFPNNVAWDYAFYAVDDNDTPLSVLDQVANSLVLSYSAPNVDIGSGAQAADYTYLLGYDYSFDPLLMYCAENMTSISANNWWLPSCTLSGGSSGGPWIQPLDTNTGDGPVMSVVSWGYTTSPGMAGPKVNGTSTQCLFNTVTDLNQAPTSTSDGDAGIIIPCS